MKKDRHFLINYFRPNMFVNSYQQIDILSIKKNNIKLVVCDLDNTLAPHFSRLPTSSAITFCQKIKDLGVTFVLASNNFKKRVMRFASLIKPDEVLWNCKKPLMHKIKKTIKKYNVKPNEILFIGDQFLIDIFCANRFGAKSILVFPLTDVSYKVTGKKISFIEKYIYKKISLNNINNNSLDNQSLDSYDII